jgi:hypothetical protein
MFLSPPEFTQFRDQRGQPGKTSQPDAWRDNYYETYRIHVELPAVRVHPRGAPSFGRWFAVDTYNMPLAAYRKQMALIHPAEVAESFILRRGGVFNVGKASAKGKLPGGGLQFEYVEGALPQHNERVPNLKAGSRVPL